MSEIWTLGFITSVLAAAISTGAALLYAALGETLAERSGVLNLGVEGMMLVGALSGFAFCYWTDSAWVGLLGAIVFGGLLAAVHAVLVVGLHANQVVSGLALTLFGQGVTAYMGASMVGKPAPDSFGRLAIPLLSEIPRLGRILFHQNIMVYAAYAVVPLLWYFMFKI